MPSSFLSLFKRFSKRQPSICIVIPYFGAWPEWMGLFLESCRANPSVDWLFYTDCKTPQTDIPSNVRFTDLQIQDFLAMAERKVGIRIAWDNPYKICDLRPAFGLIFEEQLRRHQFWGWGDIDVIYGNIRLHLTEEMMSKDCVSFSKEHLSGHLCLWRNNQTVNNWFRSLPDWQERMENLEYTQLDESHPDVIPDNFRVHAEYSFNTPLSPKTPWTDGTFNCPNEWYWTKGSLTNDIDGNREFLYLHFMHWKGGPWPRKWGNAQWEKLDKLVHLAPGRASLGFRINENGFFPLTE
ncbi:MAG: hypothetical protein OQJ84_09525 [Xanthomonadales bacterium]|nr:hypothetical protein [Xanthomonadales bacterium]